VFAAAKSMAGRFGRRRRFTVRGRLTPMSSSPQDLMAEGDGARFPFAIIRIIEVSGGGGS